jgi:4-amino-4-deoxy-L-arabinose transferase-like glycosyltransferase
MDAAGGGAGPPEGAPQSPAWRPIDQTAFFAGESRDYWFLVAAVFAVAVVMRLAFLAADPPWDFTWSQDVFTDGARVVDGARNKMLFGSWITDPRSPVVLFYPLSNIFAWVIFLIAGIGLWQANLTSVLPGIASVALMFYAMRKLEGRLGGLLGLVVLGFAYVHVIFSRVPLVESLLILMVLASFWLALGGKRSIFLSGFLVGIASFMVKMHAMHLVPVVLVFLAVDFGQEDAARPRKLHLALSFLGGIVAAVGVWVVTIYMGHSAIVAKYFKSNILLAQKSDYQDITASQVIARRLGGLMHVGAGRDGYFVKISELSLLAFMGLLGIASRFSWKTPRAARWEVFSAIWFVGLVAAMSLMGYRPLRYLVIFTPSICLLAVSFLLRIGRGEPWLVLPRPRWFIFAFGGWLAWVVIHLQQDLVFQIMTGRRSIVLGTMSDFQRSLYRYQFAILLQLLIFGGACALVTILLRNKIRHGSTVLPGRYARPLLVAGCLAVIGLNSVRFVTYGVDRKYSIMEVARSAERILSDNVFLVGDCANTIALETKFKSLAAYGDLMRYNEKAEFQQYPVTHFLLRYPALYNYLRDNFPEFADNVMPVRLYGLCGREATLLRFELWPGYAKSGYRLSEFERANKLLNEGNPAAAVPVYQDFLVTHPTSYEALWGLAVCQLQRGELEEARDFIERALELTKTDALSYEVYADVMQDLGQPREAILYWNRALEFSPGNKRVMRKMGVKESDEGEGND